MLLKLPSVMKETALSRSSIYAAVKSGTFPAPILIGKRAVAWRAEDLASWRNSRRPSLGNENAKAEAEVCDDLCPISMKSPAHRHSWCSGKSVAPLLSIEGAIKL